MDNSCAWFDGSCYLSWWQQEIKGVYLWILDSFYNGLATVLEAFPVPDFMANFNPVLMPPNVSWFLQPFNLPYGLTVVVSAYVARFILRRIPFIGG